MSGPLESNRPEVHLSQHAVERSPSPFVMERFERLRPLFEELQPEAEPHQITAMAALQTYTNILEETGHLSLVGDIARVVLGPYERDIVGLYTVFREKPQQWIRQSVAFANLLVDDTSLLVFPKTRISFQMLTEAEFARVQGVKGLDPENWYDIPPHFPKTS